MVQNRLETAPYISWGWAITAFFVLLAVANSLILYLAVSSNPGTLVENPYSEGLLYQRRLDARALFVAKGYTFALKVQTGGKGIVLLLRDRNGKAVRGVSGSLTMTYPRDGTADRSCVLKWLAETSEYYCEVELTQRGLWVADVELKDGDELMEIRDAVQLTF